MNTGMSVGETRARAWQVSRCRQHGVCAMFGGLANVEGCNVHSNTLSGINAIGKGSCVRCTACRVRPPASSLDELSYILHVNVHIISKSVTLLFVT
jgi:hypothetical protein